MLQHQTGVHGADKPPEFAFKVVKQCKSSLERQVREAVRIQMRGNVLNVKGTYNRCKLTRLVVDEEWEQKVWKDSWEPRVVTEEEDVLRADSSKTRKREDDKATSKKRRIEEGAAWGDASPSHQKSRSTFLYTGISEDRAGTKARQATIQPLSGVEWLSRSLVESLVKIAVDVGEWSKAASTWEEWEPEEQTQGRSRAEEKWLWKQLDECDSRQAKLEKWQGIKKSRKVAKARTKMMVGKEQPSIKDKFVISKQLGGSRLDTTPAVPAPTSSQAVQAMSVAKPSIQQPTLCNLNLGVAQLQEMRPAQLTTDQPTNSLTVAKEQRQTDVLPKPAPAHPISHPRESSEAFAGVGLLTEEVSPKKLKTGKNQQPRPAVEPLLRVVRGVGGSRGSLKGGKAISKFVKGGGGCVNTQTGSVRVAASQSNTVIPDVSLEEFDRAVPQSLVEKEKVENLVQEEGGGCVNTQTGSVRVAASQSNTVIHDVSLEERDRAVPQSLVVNLAGNSSARPVSRIPSMVKSEQSVVELRIPSMNNSEQNVAKMSQSKMHAMRVPVNDGDMNKCVQTECVASPGALTSLSQIETVEGGPHSKRGGGMAKRFADIFGGNKYQEGVRNKMTKPATNKIQKKKENSTPSSKQKSKTYNSGGNMNVRLNTPIKRKLHSDNNTKTLISKFESQSENK